MKNRKKRTARKPFFTGFALGVVLGIVALFAFGALSDSSEPPGSSASPDGPATAVTTATAGSAIPVAVESAEKAPRPFTLVAVGDILLARRVGERIASAGWEAPFAPSTPLLSSADLAFANLECPVSYLGTPFPGKPPVVTFRAEPGALFGLKKSGIDVVSLANNHMNDYGPEALTETLDALDVLGIARSGAGRNRAEARRPAILEAGSRRVAVLAYAEPVWSVVGAADGPGVAPFDAAGSAADIAAARTAADIVLVSMHWGEEHRGFPQEKDRAIARALIDAGADAVLGHHPHVLQGAEFHRGAPILYSLGNFVFDMISPKTYESAAAILRFSPDSRTKVSLIPLRIDAKTFAPAPAEGEDRVSIGRLIVERSALLGSPSLIRADGSIEIIP